MAAFDVDTGALIDTFLPSIDGPVEAVQLDHDAADEVWLGGNFDNIDGATRRNLAKMQITTGGLLPWTADTDGRIQEIVLTPDDRMFVGGAFDLIGGADINRLAELDPETGAVNPAFSFEFTGEAGLRAAGQNIRFAGVTSDETRLVLVHTAAAIDGQPKRGAAVFDISDPNAPTMTAFSANGYADGLRYSTYAPSVGALAPDNSFFILVTTGHVIAFDPNGGAESPRLWEKDHQDSVFSVAISNNAVYTGGHFCKIASGPKPTDLIGGGFTDKTCSGTEPPYPQDGAYRYQMAALDPTDGTPLPWDPGTDVFRGIVSLEVTPRGLLAGGDGMFTGGVRTGRFAFFDLGARSVDTSAPTVDVTTPARLEGATLVLSADVTDDRRTRRLKIRVIDANGHHLQDDGSFADAVNNLDLDPGFAQPGTARSLSTSVSLADGDYTIRYRAADQAFNSNGWQNQSLTVGAAPPPLPPCSVALIAGAPRVSWTAVDGEDTYVVRRNGRYLTTTTDLNHDDTTAPIGLSSYVIRTRIAGVVNDVDCGSIEVDGVAPACSVSLVDGTPVISWQAVPGEDTYVIRRNGTYLATTSDLTYRDDTAPAGLNDYVIRTRMAGVVTDTAC